MCSSLRHAAQRTKMEGSGFILLRLGHLGLDILDLCKSVSVVAVRLARIPLSTYLIYCGRHDAR